MKENLIGKTNLTLRLSDAVERKTGKDFLPASLSRQAGGMSSSSEATLLALMPTWLALAWLVSQARWVWGHRPEMQFGWLVLVLAGYLAWENWEKRPPILGRMNLSVMVGFILGVGLVFIVQIYQAFFGMNSASLLGHYLGTGLVVYANLMFVFGLKGIMVFGFAYIFFGLAMPMPSVVQGPMISSLQSLVASINVEILTVIGVPASKVGSLIQLPIGTVGVNEACSGARSLQATIMAALFVGYTMMTGWGARFGLLVVGVLMAIVGNVGRSLYLSLLANSKGIAAVETAHDSAGWTVLLFTAGSVALVAWLLGKIEKFLARSPQSNAEVV